MRWRVEYEKGSVIKFLSHLDMVRLWERLFRRSNLPLQLTQGFNPRLKLSLGTVLPVGLWGKREYLDVELNGSFKPPELQSRLQEVSPPGIKVLQLKEISSVPSLMSIVNASAYRISFPSILKNQVSDGVKKIEQAPEIMITRRKNQRVVNIRPGILNFEFFETQEVLELEALVVIGNREAVRFQELLLTLVDFGLPQEEMMDFWREANYIRSNGNLKDPMQL